MPDNSIINTPLAEVDKYAPKTSLARILICFYRICFRPDADALGVDALITGEVFEWETSEFARDAWHLGLGKGLIVTGHAASEELKKYWW